MSILCSLCMATAIGVGCGGATFTAAPEDGGSGSDGGVADGSVSSDASVTDGPTTTNDGGSTDGDGGLGLEGGVGSCSGSSAIFANIIKGCTLTSACVVVFHQLDCCGSMAAVGVNHASKETFTADEATWAMTCPGCGCSAKPTIGEDGKTSTNQSDFRVACVNGACRSFLP